MYNETINYFRGDEMSNILQNEYLIIESKNQGAELTRIYSKKLNKEILWNGDDKYWARHSPILFPIVGRLKDNNTIIENQSFTMSQHGFARDIDFKVIDNSNNSISYTLISNEITKKYYPYSFELIIKYTLEESSINIEWTINNTDSKDIYFSIGAHPAFNIDTNNLSNHYLAFKCRDNIEKIELDGPFASSKSSIHTLDIINLNPEIFEKDALIYTNIDEITLHSKVQDDFIKVSLENFPLVGIWTPYYKDTKSTAPFLCIEPWYGLADDINTDGQYMNKSYINTLSIGESFNAYYDISVG